jgi:cytoskeletal protein CcmA (bactofilin family)
MKKKNEVIAFLGKGTKFEGKMRFHGTTRIDGHFKGEISADGNLIISNQGLVEANVHASSIMISGEVHGNITADQRVDIHAPAKVFGDIQAPSVVIDEGVIFEGMTRMKQPKRTEETTPVAVETEEVSPVLKTLTGTITDQDTGEPVSGADIKIKGSGKRETEADVAGYFQFSDLEDGTWELTIKAEGYHKEKAQVEIQGEGMYERNVALEPKH